MVNNVLASALAARVAATTTEHSSAAKEAFEKVERIASRTSRTSSLQSLLSVLIVDLALLRVAQRLIRFRDLLKLQA